MFLFLVQKKRPKTKKKTVPKTSSMTKATKRLQHVAALAAIDVDSGCLLLSEPHSKQAISNVNPTLSWSYFRTNRYVGDYFFGRANDYFGVGTAVHTGENKNFQLPAPISTAFCTFSALSTVASWRQHTAKERNAVGGRKARRKKMLSCFTIAADRPRTVSRIHFHAAKI